MWKLPSENLPLTDWKMKLGNQKPLSKREIEVLQLIAQGLSNQEVGERLYLTLNTVKAYSRTIYSKLEVNNRTQAVSKARALRTI